MAYLKEWAEDSFVLIQADWTVGTTRQLLEDDFMGEATHIIIHRTEDFGEFYYLFTFEEAMNRLDAFNAEVPILYAFDLHESGETRKVDAYADADIAPDRAVILDEGDLIGFYDVRTPPSFMEFNRGKDDEIVPRSLITEFPEKVPLHKTVSLLVYLSAQMDLSSASHPGLPIMMPLGAKVDLFVRVKSGFAIISNNEGSITVTDEDETLPIQFKLTAIKEGPGKIDILAFYEGQSLGAVTLVPQVVGETEVVDETPVDIYQGMLPVSTHTPDLQLLILENRVNGQTTLTLRLTAKDSNLGLKFQPYGPVSIKMNPAEYFADFFKRIDNLNPDTPEEREITEIQLGAMGLELFDNLIPKPLQVLLWSLRSQIKTVQIVSEEPWIPWELCKLQHEKDGVFEEGDFLCEAFSVTRWLPANKVKSPPSTLTLNKMGIVIPSNSRLKYAPAEKEFLMNLTGNGRQVEEIQPNTVPLIKALSSGRYDGLHFTGHGNFNNMSPNRSVIKLDNGQVFQPILLNNSRNLGLAHPLVFMNACQIGQGSLSLTDIGGWSAKFLKAGAGAFIGAFWSIFDKPALDFAKELYKGLLDDHLPIGEAAHAARLAIKKQGETTRLAYTVFADPLATVEFS